MRNSLLCGISKLIIVTTNTCHRTLCSQFTTEFFNILLSMPSLFPGDFLAKILYIFLGFYMHVMSHPLLPWVQITVSASDWKWNWTEGIPLHNFPMCYIHIKHKHMIWRSGHYSPWQMSEPLLPWSVLPPSSRECVPSQRSGVSLGLTKKDKQGLHNLCEVNSANSSYCVYFFVPMFLHSCWQELAILVSLFVSNCHHHQACFLFLMNCATMF